MKMVGFFVSSIIYLITTIFFYFVVGDFVYKTSPPHAIMIAVLLLVQFISKLLINNYLINMKGDKNV